MLRETFYLIGNKRINSLVHLFISVYVNFSCIWFCFIPSLICPTDAIPCSSLLCFLLTSVNVLPVKSSHSAPPNCAGSSLLPQLFSSCREQGDSLVAGLGLLLAVACLVAEHGL